MKKRLIFVFSLFFAGIIFGGKEKKVEAQTNGSPLLRIFHWNDGDPYCAGMYGDCLPTVVVTPEKLD